MKVYIEKREDGRFYIEDQPKAFCTVELAAIRARDRGDQPLAPICYLPHTWQNGDKIWQLFVRDVLVGTICKHGQEYWVIENDSSPQKTHCLDDAKQVLLAETWIECV